MQPPGLTLKKKNERKKIKNYFVCRTHRIEQIIILPALKDSIISEVRSRKKPRDNLMVHPEPHDNVNARFSHTNLIC